MALYLDCRSMAESPSTAPDQWESHAQWWQSEFTDGADVEYVEQIMPLAAQYLSGIRNLVDVGTGEGQLARMADRLGCHVVGLDPTWAQIAEAARRGHGPAYIRATAGALPLADGSVDGVLACLVFEHIHDADGAIAEVARVLAPGGRFVFFLNHPLLQTPGSGWIDDHVLDPPEQYWRIGAYLTESEVVEEVAKDVFIPFVHRPLGQYVNGLIDHGLILERMVEPAPPPGFLAQAEEYGAAATIPRLLLLVCRRVANGF